MSDEQKGPAEPISAGLAPLYALAKRWGIFSRDEAGGMCSGEAAEAGRCARELLAALPDVATDLNFKINNWLGQQANEALKQQRIEAAVEELREFYQRDYWDSGEVRELLTRVAG